MDLVDVIERELDVHEMVLAHPQVIRRLKAERIARAVNAHLAKDEAPQPYRHVEIGYRLVESPEGDKLQYYQEPA